jgi:hypothetical protein
MEWVSKNVTMTRKVTGSIIRVPGELPNPRYKFSQKLIIGDPIAFLWGVE